MRALAWLATCPAADRRGGREHRLSQLDRTQGLPLHIFVGCLAHHRRGARLSRLGPDDARETRVASLGTACGRRRLGADLARTRGSDETDARQLDARHGYGPTGSGIAD